MQYFGQGCTWPEFNYKEISDKAKTSNMLLRNSEKWSVFFKRNSQCHESQERLGKIERDF